ncbi:MAG: hypothetical protein JNM13_09205 [Hyphomicrobiaceae bacterium]|nr:hypothetical protein [Hyphomicrobiaceae bacterium]
MYTKADITGIVLDFVRRTIPDLKYAEIDTSAPLHEIGATSIDMLEVVSAAMRKLNVDVPRDALGGLGNVDDLVELLLRIVAPREAGAA